MLSPFQGENQQPTTHPEMLADFRPGLWASLTLTLSTHTSECELPAHPLRPHHGAPKGEFRQWSQAIVQGRFDQPEQHPDHHRDAPSQQAQGERGNVPLAKDRPVDHRQHDRNVNQIQAIRRVTEPGERVASRHLPHLDRKPDSDCPAKPQRTPVKLPAAARLWQHPPNVANQTSEYPPPPPLTRVA